MKTEDEIARYYWPKDSQPSEWFSAAVRDAFDTGIVYAVRRLAAFAETKEATTDQKTDRRLREHLCFSHGHTGQYGDDGELQCGQCAGFGQWDYRRAPIADLLDTIERVNTARLGAGFHDNASAGEGNQPPGVTDDARDKGSSSSDCD